jgi:adenosine deaminase CECR1
VDQLLKTMTDIGQVQSMDRYNLLRKELIEQDRSTHFTTDVLELTDKEKQVEKILFEKRSKLVYEDHSPLLLDFFEGQKVIKDGEVHNFFKAMPKGGHMHIHIEASVAMDTFMNFTNEDFVYYNMDKNELLAAPNGVTQPGFITCNQLRKEWKKDGSFDEYLVSKLLLSPEDIKSRESHEIWKGFQHKFVLNDAIIHYYKFYRAGLLAYYEQAISEGVSIIELRHTSGILFDENHNFLSYSQEFNLYKSVIDEIKQKNPDFEIRVIIVAFKAMGREAIKVQLDSYLFALDNGYNFITGFDLVNEEDFTEPIYDFVEDMLAAKVKYGDKFNFYFHSGESSSRFNENLYDAILLGTKRIGHGIGLVLHPKLIQLVKEKQIGYEI